jgi:hypothetical protein
MPAAIGVVWLIATYMYDDLDKMPTCNDLQSERMCLIPVSIPVFLPDWNHMVVTYFKRHDENLGVGGMSFSSKNLSLHVGCFDSSFEEFKYSHING